MKPLYARRRFLRGAGGVALGLPFLPSLCKTAFGADPVVPRRARFVNLATWHGGIYGSNMFPPDADVTDKQMLGMWDAALGTHLKLPLSALTADGANGAAILVQSEKDGLPGPILGAASIQL